MASCAMSTNSLSLIALRTCRIAECHSRWKEFTRGFRLRSHFWSHRDPQPASPIPAAVHIRQTADI